MNDKNKTFSFIGILLVVCIIGFVVNKKSSNTRNKKIGKGVATVASGGVLFTIIIISLTAYFMIWPIIKGL